MKTKQIVALVVVCLIIASSVFPQAELPASDQKALETLKYSLDLSAQVKDQVWPGFDLNQFSFALSHPQRGAYLIAFDRQPAKSTVVKTGLFGASVYFTTDNHDMVGNTSMEVAGKNTALIQLNSLGGGVEAGLQLIFHESFHAFEHSQTRPGAKWRFENAMLIPDYPESSARNGAIYRVEGELLFSALQASDESTSRKKAAQFIAIRKLRQKELEPRMVDFEQNLESNEGLADYVGNRAVMLAIQAANQKSISIPLTLNDANAYLLTQLKPLNTITQVGQNARERYYYTGAAEGFLLDRLMPDWKKRVQMDGAVLQDLIEEATRAVSPTEQTIADATLREYSYDNIFKEEEISAAKKAAKAQAVLDSVVNQAGEHYIIDVSGVGRMGNTLGFDPWNITVVTKQKRVHTDMLKIGDGKLYQAEFRQPVVEDLQNQRYVTVASMKDKQELIVDGERIDPSKPIERQFKNGLKISTPNFQFEAPSGWLIIKENEVTVRLGKPGLAAGANDGGAGPAPARSIVTPHTPYEVELSELTGKPRSLAEFKGQQLYLLFICAQDWAKPAHKYLDELSGLARQGYKLKPGVTLLVVASQSGLSQTQDFFSGRQVQFPALFDSDGIGVIFLNPTPGNVAFPFIVGIDPSGQKDFEQSGFTPENLEQFKKLVFVSR